MFIYLSLIVHILNILSNLSDVNLFIALARIPINYYHINQTTYQ